MRKNRRTKPLPKAGGSKTALNSTVFDWSQKQSNSEPLSHALNLNASNFNQCILQELLKTTKLPSTRFSPRSALYSLEKKYKFQILYLNGSQGYLSH